VLGPVGNHNAMIIKRRQSPSEGRALTMGI
jgi:hypothetical protein